MYHVVIVQLVMFVHRPTVLSGTGTLVEKHNELNTESA
jgi:hypothetical protein